MNKVSRNLTVENARIAFRNFAGKESKFNRAGARNFCIIFDRETGEGLAEDGWNVRMLQAREEGDDPSYALSVSVAFGNIPPHIYMISGRTKVELDEGSINCLDYAEIINVDAVVRPYNWEVNGKTGVKAYVQTLYVEVQEDKFSSKYDFKDNFDEFGDASF